jgi:hypothetical protein
VRGARKENDLAGGLQGKRIPHALQIERPAGVPHPNPALHHSGAGLNQG